MEMHVRMWWKMRCRDLFIYLFIMEIGVGNPIENEIPWPFFMCKYWNLIENRIERLNFFNENAC